MAESNVKPPQLSVQILLPEAIDRRIARWTKHAPGASWPAWGGHITLIPAFVQRGTLDEISDAVAGVCSKETPFEVWLGEPLALQDRTRPDYFALFLSVESGADLGHNAPINKAESLVLLRERLLLALAELRQDIYPQLVEKSYLPHITLALGLGEAEANGLVKELKLLPITAEFVVDGLWIVVQSGGQPAQTERRMIPFGKSDGAGQTLDGNRG